MGEPFCRASYPVEQVLPFYIKPGSRRASCYELLQCCTVRAKAVRNFAWKHSKTVLSYFILFTFCLKIAVFQLESYQCHGT